VNNEHLTTQIQYDLFDGYICTKFLQSICSLFGPTFLLPLADLFGLLSISVPDEHEDSCSDENDTNDAADDNASDGSSGETNFHSLNSN